MKVNTIGLNKAKSENTINLMNDLLANYQQFYMNLRGFHWNIKGRSFFELHVKFEELYTDVNLKVDEIAERILSLDGVPLHSFTDYQKTTTIQEVKNLTKGDDIVAVILEDFKIIIEKQREVLSEAGKNEDEGTITLMSDYITEQEKTMWMLKAYLA
jgi:starvation-inducible DNA-binding protein